MAAWFARPEVGDKFGLRVVARPTEGYAHYVDGIGRSKLTLKAVETALGVKTTGRNWNTALKLQPLAAA